MRTHHFFSREWLMLALVQASASFALAQNASEGMAETERVIVTGSFIPTAETESALPVTVITGASLQKQGANTPAEGLRQLPSFVGTTATENDSNNGDGQAFVNLRALGSENTLVLINGRRAFGFTNVNAIPIAALARTEVLKDGASAIYGSDAVGGVVNFILLSGPGEAPYEGAEINLLYGNTTDHDAHVLQAYVRGGVHTDKVAIAVAAEYYSRASIYARDREISRSADTRSLGGRGPGNVSFGGILERVVDPNPPGGGPPAPARLILIDLSENAPSLTSYRRVNRFSNDIAAFNGRAYTPAIPGVEKAEYYITGNYKVFGDALQVYGDVLYAKTKQDNGVAPAPFSIPVARYENAALGIFNGRDERGRLDGSLDNSNAAQLAIVQHSPYNPFGLVTRHDQNGKVIDVLPEVSTLTYRLVQELNNRRNFFDYDFYRYLGGVKGDFSFTGNHILSFLGYDAGFVYERADYLRIDTGDATRGGIYQEIISGSFNPFIGLNAPTSGTVPTYFDGAPTGTTAAYDNVAAAKRASYLGRSYTYAHDFLADAKVNGNVFPQLYQGGIAFNIGGEYRLSRDEVQPNAVQEAGEGLALNKIPATDYEQEVRSFFAELTIPLVTSTLKIPAVRSLDLSFAYRYEKFDDKDRRFGTKASFDNGGTPRISLRYQPTADLTLRASWGQSFLSPSPHLLFDPEVATFSAVYDRVIDDFVEPVDGIFVSGNSKLKPEETNTYTAGLVYTPKFLPGFTTTVDFYQVYTTNVILDPLNFAQIAVTANGNAGGGPNAPFAQFIQRADGPNGPQTGEIISMTAENQNASKRLVNGMDVTATYEIPTQDLGTFTISVGYNYFFTWKAEPYAGAGTTNFLGDYLSSSLPLAPGAIPYHKGYLRGEWRWKGFDFASTVNYISSFNDDSSKLARANIVNGSDNAPPPTFPQYDTYRRVSDYVTLDMQLSYEFSKTSSAETGTFLQRLLWGTKLTVGVNNAFDRNPPTVLGALNDNYDTSLYSIRNRYYYIALSKKF